MPKPAHYVDRPGRRIAISVSIAVAAHVLVGATAWWLFKDYATPGLTVAPGYHRIDRAEIEQVLSEMPIIAGANSVGFSTGDAGPIAEDWSFATAAWDQTRAISPADAGLPFGTINWQFDQMLLTPTGPAPRSPNRTPAPNR